MFLYLNVTKTFHFKRNFVIGNENDVEWKRLWVKWNEPPPTTPKACPHPKKVLLCIWWNWKGICNYELLLKNQIIISNKQNQMKPALNKKHPEVVSRVCIIFHQDNAKPQVFWWPGKNCYIFARKFLFIQCIHQISHL